jgi:hypothetical protein
MHLPSLDVHVSCVNCETRRNLYSSADAGAIALLQVEQRM